MPILAIAAIGLLFSTVFRNSAAAVVGTLDGLAPAPADRDPARPRIPAALPAQHAVQLLAGTAARADRLGSDRARSVGLLPLRRACARRRLPRLPAPGRRRRLSGPRADPARGRRGRPPPRAGRGRRRRRRPEAR